MSSGYGKNLGSASISSVTGDFAHLAVYEPYETGELKDRIASQWCLVGKIGVVRSFCLTKLFLSWIAGACSLCWFASRPHWSTSSFFVSYHTHRSHSCLRQPPPPSKTHRSQASLLHSSYSSAQSSASAACWATPRSSIGWGAAVWTLSICPVP